MVAVDSKRMRKLTLSSRFDQLRTLVNAALQIIRMFEFHEGVQSLDAHKEVLGLYKEPVHGVPMFLRIAQFEVKPPNEIRNKFGDLHEGNMSTKTCARAKTVLSRLSANKVLKLRPVILTGIQWRVMFISCS